jgi:transposase-like protein
MRRKFNRAFKIEAVGLVTDRGVAVAQAARDLNVAESVLRRWMKVQGQVTQDGQLHPSRRRCGHRHCRGLPLHVDPERPESLMNPLSLGELAGFA